MKNAEESFLDGERVRAEILSGLSGVGAALSSGFPEALARRVENLSVYIKEESKSTNSDLGELYNNEGFSSPILLAAKRQSAGRGRLGRSWHFEEGGSLALSLGFEMDLGLDNLESLTVLCGLEIAKALRAAFGAPFMVKWPNDIYLSGRKISGMLAQMHVKDSSRCGIIFGIGLNLDLKNPPADLRESCASLSEAAEAFDPNGVAALLALCVLKSALILERGGALNPAEFEGYDYLRGKRVRAAFGGEEIEGEAVGISAKGELLIAKDDANGQIISLNSGEAALIK